MGVTASARLVLVIGIGIAGCLRDEPKCEKISPLSADAGWSIQASASSEGLRLAGPANPPGGCRFHTRCPWRQETRCDHEVPVLRELAPGRLVSCHWAEDIRDGLLQPKSAEEVAAIMGVSVRGAGAEAIETDALVQGIDQPIERT